MNVNDIVFEKPEGDMLELIFKRQEELKEKYHHIEEKQGVGYGLLKGQKFDINTTLSQELIKNFAWRVVEEITEAFDCNLVTEKHHLYEELADALHFLVELALITGITPDDICEGSSKLPEAVSQDKLVRLCTVRHPDRIDPYPPIHQLGLAMNCLKQKPWKQTHILTDTKKFKSHIIKAFHEFFKVFVKCGTNANAIFMFYFKKSEVNKFRQESNY